MIRNLWKLAAAAALVLASCQGPFSAPDAPAAGRITVSVTGAKTLASSMDPIVAEYDVEAYGPDGQVLSAVLGPDSTVSFADVPVGPWGITVTGRNAQGSTLVTGQTSVVVARAETARAEVRCSVVEGWGGGVLNLSWDPGLVGVPEVRATLSPMAESEAPEVGIMTSDGASVLSFPEVPSGYYLLRLQLWEQEEEVLVWSTVEVVHILAGDFVTGSWNLSRSKMNLVETGGLRPQIGVDTQDPVEVSIEGIPAVADLDDALSASVAGGEALTGATWYLDGTVVAEGPQADLGTDVAPGRHTLSVVAAVGGRLGSADASVVVADLGAPVTGRLADAEGQPVVGALVQVWSDQRRYGAVTDADGVFSLWVREGHYQVSTQAEGWVPFRADGYVVTAGSPLDLGLPPALASDGTGTLRGTIGPETVAGTVVLRIIEGWTPGGPVVLTLDETGATYQVEGLPAGYYTVTASAPGYLAASVQVAVGISPEGDEAPPLNLVAAHPEVKFMVSWEAEADLDGSLFTPWEEVIAFYHPTGRDGVFQDRDCTWGPGSETITVPQQAEGTYSYTVFNNANLPWSALGVRVTVFLDGQEWQVLTPPEGLDSRTWNVCSLNGGTLTLGAQTSEAEASVVPASAAQVLGRASHL